MYRVMRRLVIAHENTPTQRIDYVVDSSFEQPTELLYGTIDFYCYQLSYVQAT
jgi:hypothetical protein